jgi:ABC-2 type transport system ATP-binding protein
MNQMTPPDAGIAIHCERLSVQGDGRPVLDAITLAVPRGAVVGLVGRNGAGKSTLLRCLVGLTAPGAGASSLLGCPSLALTDAVRGRLGYVAQTPDLFDWMTVHEHLETIGRAYPTWNDERSLILAGRLGLQLGQSVRKLSGGDQQKLAVVLAHAHAPDDAPRIHARLVHRARRRRRRARVRADHRHLQPPAGRPRTGGLAHRLPA